MPGMNRLRVRPHASGLVEYPPGTSFGPRVLLDYEFVWIVSGEVRWNIGERAISVPTGSILLARPGMRDSFVWDPRRRTHHGYVHFGIEDPGSALPPEADWPLSLSANERNALAPLLEHILWSLRNPDVVALALVEHSMRQALMMFVFRAFGVGGEELPGEHSVVAATLRCLRRAWSAGKLVPLEVAALARKAGVSEGHFIRTLRAELGLTPHQLMLLIRLERAANLLSRTNLSVMNVADQCGFESPFHFSRRFSQAYGLGPREFRKRVLRGESPGRVAPSSVQRFAYWLFG
jgi:AraC family transcriptional regulator